MQSMYTLGNTIEKRMNRLPNFFPSLPLLGMPSFLSFITSPGDVMSVFFTSTVCPSKCWNVVEKPDWRGGGGERSETAGRTLTRIKVLHSTYKRRLAQFDSVMKATHCKIGTSDSGKNAEFCKGRGLVNNKQASRKSDISSKGCCRRQSLAVTG